MKRELPLPEKQEDHQSPKKMSGRELIENVKTQNLKRDNDFPDVETEKSGFAKGNGNKIEKLDYFGYDIFTKSQGMVLGNSTINDGYKVGPGDAFQIAVWGSEEASFTAEITTDGHLLLPTFGRVKVGGVTFALMKKRIKELVSRDLTGFELSVMPIKARRNNVFVVGEVNTPGVYELEGTASALTSLFAAGGPTTHGTLRRVEIRRGKKLVSKFDLYEFLTKGDRSKDVKLREGDTIFVPLAGPRVKVTGAVKRPAIYELKNGEMTLGDAIEVAGGIIPTADLQKIQIQRTMAHSQRVVFSREVSRNDNRFAGNATVVQDLDVIRVFSISPRKVEMVTLEGHVFEPGPRPWTDGIMLSQVLQDASMLKKDPALEYGEILREGGLGGEYQVVSFNPGRILEGDSSADIQLEPKDRVVIFPMSLMKDNAKVSVNGYVLYPGTVEFTPGLRVKDLIYRCGGLKNGASIQSAELSRRSIKGGKLSLSRIEIDLGKAMKGDSRHNLAVEPFDSLIVRPVPDWKVDNFIVLSGEVEFPGKYSFQPGERLSSVLKRAKGFNKRAYLKAAVFTRESVRNVQNENNLRLMNHLQQERIEQGRKNLYTRRSYVTEKTARDFALERQEELMDMLSKTQPAGRVVIKLNELHKFEGSKYDIALEPGDKLYIPPRPSSVMVEGAVYNSMGILWEMNKSINYYLNRVGGVSKDGDLGNIYLIRADGTVVSRKTSGRYFIKRTLVEPGDTVFVPTKIRVPVDRWQRSLDVMKTISSLALTALAIDRYK
jgi:protein involved in polysaccharide export with SLBB domain